MAAEVRLRGRCRTFAGPKDQTIGGIEGTEGKGDLGKGGSGERSDKGGGGGGERTGALAPMGAHQRIAFLDALRDRPVAVATPPSDHSPAPPSPSL